MASELHPWRFELEIFPSRLHYGHVFEPKLNAQQGAICEAFFSKCFEQSTSWCFGSHFFAARSHPSHCHLPLSFSGFIFFFLSETKSMERKLLCQLLTATNCSTLARHALKLICQTTLIQFCSSRYWAMRVTSCCDVTEVTWPKRGIFSCRRRRCSKRRVCFHSNQYFYVPQENVNLSNEQREC